MPQSKTTKKLKKTDEKPEYTDYHKMKDAGNKKFKKSNYQTV